jgi:hypothetical protein
VHLNFGMHSLLRPFLGIDAQFGPARARGVDETSDGRLPTWAVGLLAGASVGTR